MSSPVREQFLLISAIGASAMELTQALCTACSENRCSITSSRLNRYGEFSALILQVSGSWDTLARLESILPGLAKKHTVALNVIRSRTAEKAPQALPYIAYVNAVYRPDILGELCQFFSNHHIALENLTCDTYQAPQTGGTMLTVTLTLTLPPGTQISWLREQFLDFADMLNLDALLEPWRPQTP